jgi:rhodanese-related sulfurtransferase
VAQRLARPELAAASQSDPSTLLVVDVRSRRQFARGHLPLSHAIPAGLLVSGEWPEGDLLLVDDGNGEAERVREALHRGGYPRRL